MSIFSQNEQKSGDFGSAAAKLKNALARGDDFQDTQRAAEAMLSQESLDEGAKANMLHVAKETRSSMRTIMEEAGLSVEDIK